MRWQGVHTGLHSCIKGWTCDSGPTETLWADKTLHPASTLCAVCLFVLQRQQQAELLRMLRAEEAQARFDYIRSRAAEVGERDMARREELARKLEVSEWLQCNSRWIDEGPCMLSTHRQT